MYNEKDIEYRLQSGIISNMDFHDTQTLLYLKNKVTANYKELAAAVQCPDFFIVTNKLAALHLIEIFPCKTSLKPDCYASDAYYTITGRGLVIAEQLKNGKGTCKRTCIITHFKYDTV